jgi:hypothetical protein
VNDERAAATDRAGGRAPDAPQAGLRSEVLREGATMALYVSLSLLAVMVALPKDVAPASSDSPAAVIFFTSLGLLLAHQLAFRISAQLAHRGLLSEHLEILGAHLAGGALVTAIAVVPVLVIGGPAGVVVSELALLGFIAVVGYLAARSVPLGRIRSLVYVAGVVALTLAILWIETFVDH